ncbi:hypothetical protein KCTC32516_01678 [Polaribacter huanghezhanensis]|uniref:hypothetical protein n=1 Tax=Polaribacter huanghezhanensis TaxID=1354726 RepID=UPI002648218F|nr:hypothetical protein [Polaribacter huanghezhanensis]WKD86308.1 hypothetical protein KCTC32516_01678 [Polaribacter huanghezhanensis]
MPIIERISCRDFPLEDEGVKVKDVLKLIEKTGFEEELFKVFDLESIKNEFIEVPGASTLVHAILNIENRLKKIDITAQLKDVKTVGFTDENQALLEIANIENEELLKLFRKDLIDFETTYSVKADYFNQLYDMNKYLSFLLNKEYRDIVNNNIDMLEEKNKENEDEKVFKTVIDNKKNRYVRAIVSKRYKDYNIPFSVFVTLIQLHSLNKNKNLSFSVSKFSLTDSEIRVEFKNEKEYDFFDKSKVSFSLVLTNDEIKRDAVKLKGLFSINFDDVNAYLNPNEGNTNIMSFKHGVKVDNVKQKLSSLGFDILEFVNGTLDDLKFVKRVNTSTTILEIQDRLIQKVDNARDKNFLPLKEEVKKRLLLKKVDNLFDLLSLVDKVDEVFSDEYIQAQDYWRYKVYQTLVKRGK